MGENKKDIKKIVEEGCIFTNVPKAYIITKRLVDIIVALTGIMIFSPLLIMTAIAVKILSSGPVIHMQERYGLKGRTFKDYRFSTTVNHNWGITGLMSLINRYRIDRLPRLFNVLKGDMSLVGPRAPLIMEISKYATWHNLRFSVKPGITGPWQISGRMNTDFEDMVRLDIKYIRERNFWYDLRIILKTIPFLFFGKSL